MSFTSGVNTLLGRAASIEASLRNRVGLWSCPCKLTWGFIKSFSKVPNSAVCWQSQALELKPHWISLFIWIKISLNTGSPKREVAGNELLCTVIHTGSTAWRLLRWLTWERDVQRDISSSIRRSDWQSTSQTALFLQTKETYVQTHTKSVTHSR